MMPPWWNDNDGILGEDARNKISAKRERSSMYTMDMMSPVDARYLVHGLHVIGMKKRPLNDLASAGSSPYPVTDSRHVTLSVVRLRGTGSHEEH